MGKFIIDMLNVLIKSLGVVMSWVVELLPDSPFTFFDSLTLDNTWMGYIAYIVPVQQILTLLTYWITAITLFYVYSAIMRFLKMV